MGFQSGRKCFMTQIPPFHFFSHDCSIFIFRDFHLVIRFFFTRLFAFHFKGLSFEIQVWKFYGQIIGKAQQSHSFSYYIMVVSISMQGSVKDEWSISSFVCCNLYCRFCEFILESSRNRVSYSLAIHFEYLQYTWWS